MKTLTLATIAVSLLGLGVAFAAPDQTTTPAPAGQHDVAQPNMTAPVGSPQAAPAPATTPAPPTVVAPAAPPTDGNLHTVETTASPDCKLVKVSRPDVDPAKPNITVRFQDHAKADAVAKIGNCDQKATGSTFISVVPWTTTGFQVKFATKDGSGFVSLPIAMTDGSANQVVCKIDLAAKKITHAKYAMQWSGALPDEIKLVKLDSYDTAAADVGCRNALPADLLAKLEAK